MKTPKWALVVEDGAQRRRIAATGLTVTDAGWLKFWHDEKLIGVIKSLSWERVYVEAASRIPEAK